MQGYAQLCFYRCYWFIYPRSIFHYFFQLILRISIMYIWIFSPISALLQISFLDSYWQRLKNGRLLVFQPCPLNTLKSCSYRPPCWLTGGFFTSANHLIFLCITLPSWLKHILLTKRVDGILVKLVRKDFKWLSLKI